MDQGGLVQPPGAAWSLDWWIGADDRWYLPAREPTIRQRRLGAGPVVETTVRIPGGDARQLAYRALAKGTAVTVVEVHNDSPVPVAVAFALRPYPIDGRSGSGVGCGPAPPLTVGLDGSGGSSVLVNGQHLIVLPRPPNEAGAADSDDLLAVVQAGQPLVWGSAPGCEVTGPEANAVFLYPVPHRTSLRLLITDAPVAREPVAEEPVAGVEAEGAGSIREAAGHIRGAAADGGGARSAPAPGLAPDAEAVARGWISVVESGARFGFPDDGVERLMAAARARLLLAAPDVQGQAATLSPGAGDVLEALALGGHHQGLDRVLEALAATFPTALSTGPAAAAAVVRAAAVTIELIGRPPTPALVEWGAQVTHLVDSGADHEAGVTARRGLAALARAAGDRVGAAGIERGLAPLSTPDLAELLALQEGASAAGSWPGTGGADDPVAAATFVAAARHFLIDDRGHGLRLLPTFPAAWRGGNVEVHDAPTRFGRLSFGIRWHGSRPALLWDLDRAPDGAPAAGAPLDRSPTDGSFADGPAPVTIRAPGLDPDWVTTAARGETLLAGAEEALPTAPGMGDSFS